MSWDKAKTEAEEIYKNLRAKHAPGFVRMVIRALLRKLDRESKSDSRNGMEPHLEKLHGGFGGRCRQILKGTFNPRKLKVIL